LTGWGFTLFPAPFPIRYSFAGITLRIKENFRGLEIIPYLKGVATAAGRSPGSGAEYRDNPICKTDLKEFKKSQKIVIFLIFPLPEGNFQAK